MRRWMTLGPLRIAGAGQAAKKWQMGLGRLSSGEKISAGSAILLFAFMFFSWYGVVTSKRQQLLAELHLFEDGGNAWQALDVTPILLVLVVVITLGVALPRLSRLDWEPPVPPSALVCVLGGLAALLILARIVFPPDLGFESEGFVLEVTLKAGIFLALAAACGIAYGGYRAMREEGVSFADLSPRRNRGQGELRP